MKNILKLAMGAAMVLMTASCDSYFDMDLEQAIDTKDAFKDVQDVKNGMIGAYYQLGTYQFYGRDVVALGDMASDLAAADPYSGHFLYINQYLIDESDGEVTDIWERGYRVIDACTRTIKGGKQVLDNDELNLDEDDVMNVQSYLSQCYSLRALATFTLTNIYGLPYQPGKTNSQLGVILLDEEPLEPFVKVDRSTVEECYAQVLADIDNAKEYYTDESEMNGAPQFYFNSAAIFALEARVKLFMGDYEGAAEAAQTAIELRDAYPVSNDIYVTMWSSIAINDELIFAISKSDNDNLSANALNTLYGSYGGDVTEVVEGAFGENDIRANVLYTTAYKFQGTSTSQATSNIPVFRVSEMYLIIAEAQAQLGNIDEAKEALFFTAQRDTDIESADDLPSDQDELLDFIADERIRELYQEGHRWFDARRTGLKIDVASGAYPEFDVAKFVYPIPADEINAGFCSQQNEGWEDALPE